VRRLLILLVAGAALWLAPAALASGWCGGGETGADRPDVVTGAQVHAIVADPADGPDTFAADANRLADDVASILTWWQGQDPTRVPRFDEAQFGASRCLDISYLRLYETASALGSADSAFETIRTELIARGYANDWKDYLVYYDGAVTDTGTCGVGAGMFDAGPGFALVRLQACADVPTDAVAAHELLHALGAVDPGDPHQCTGDEAGHPCDSPQDVLYPYSSPGVPLSSLVLDVNHDDYYGMPPTDTWPDIQDSVWMHVLAAPQEALTVALAGTGAVVSDVPGVDCATACTTQWDEGSKLTLTGVSGRTTRFVRWGGACSGRRPCTLVLRAPESVTAVFGPRRIAVRVRTSGRGRVACAPRCSSTFPAGTALTLRARPAKGWRFAGWSGGCTGRYPVCRPATDYALVVGARFVRR
jgi:hypothetical protein